MIQGKPGCLLGLPDVRIYPEQYGFSAFCSAYGVSLEPYANMFLSQFWNSTRRLLLIGGDRDATYIIFALVVLACTRRTNLYSEVILIISELFSREGSEEQIETANSLTVSEIWLYFIDLIGAQKLKNI